MTGLHDHVALWKESSPVYVTLCAQFAITLTESLRNWNSGL